MRLRDVANRFNQTECRDAYSNAVAFKAQVLPYDEVRRDAVTLERRIFSVDPSVTLPSRRAVSAMGSVWLLGLPNVDQFMGSDIRYGYVAQAATSLSSVNTVGKLVNSVAGSQAYAGRAWVKNPAFTEQSSDLSVMYDVYLGLDEVVNENDLISYQGEYLIARAVHKTEAGFLRVTAETLGPSALSSATVSWGAYNPVTDTSNSSSATLPVLKIRWQTLFEYGNAQAPSFDAGDQQFAFSSQTVTVPVGALITLPGGSKWKVQSASLIPDSAWLCRATRHG